MEREEADRAIRPTLQTLAERIDAGEVRQLVARLPAELAPALGFRAPIRGRALRADEFVRRVAEREAVDTATAERHVQLVLAALAPVIGASEFDDVVAELSSDYWPLLPLGPEVEVLPAEEFLEPRR